MHASDLAGISGISQVLVVHTSQQSVYSWDHILPLWPPEIYSAEGKKLEDTVLSLLDRNLGQNHHIYQDNFYNSVRLAETLLDRNVGVCGTKRADRGIPCDLE